MINRHTQGERVGTAGVFRYITANGASFLAGRIGSVIVAISGRGIAQFQIDHSRLHDGALVRDVNLQNPIDPRRGDNDRLLGCDSPSTQPGTRPSGDHWNLVFAGQAKGLGNLLGILGKNNRSGPALFYSGVILIKRRSEEHTSE